MTTIYRANNARLTVADAKRLIRDAAPRGEAMDIYASVDEQGNIDIDGPIEVIKNGDVNIVAWHLDADFPNTCNEFSVIPRNKYRPVKTDYTGDVSLDDYYTIAHDEFVRLAELFGLLVVVGDAPKPQVAPVVQFTIDEDGGTTSFNATQAQYDDMVAERKAKREARQALGRYTMYEAAQVLSAVNGRDAKAFLVERMLPAVDSGALVVLNPVDGGPVTGRQCRPYDDWVTPSHIDAWLPRAGFDYLWPIVATVPQPAPVATACAIDGVEPAVDFDILARRHELIAAFGSFTGLDGSWFDNLRDRPRLLAARKVKGTGGRNYTEPLFCPYMVMQWLTTKPRQGDVRRPMSAETGWRMLKTHFPKVYCQYQIGDPNNHSAG